MPLVPYQGFVGGSYRARSSNFDSEECLNLYPETALVNSAKNVAMLIGRPALSLWEQVASTGGIRGMIRFGNAVFYVTVGGEVWKSPFNSAGVVGVSVVLAGAVTLNTSLVTMATNGINIVAAVDGSLYIIDPGALTVTLLVDPDFQGAGQVNFISGYYIWNVPGSGRSQYSNLYSTAIDPLSFFTAEALPDNLVGNIVSHLEYWAFGEYSTEIFQVTSDPNNPLQRLSGAVIEHGCAAASTIAKLNNTVYWLGADQFGQGTVWRAAGAYEPQRVSTPAIEFAISQTRDLSGSDAWTYSQEGHDFYVLTVGGRTWCFDATTELWHERSSDLNDGMGTQGAFDAQCCVIAAGKILVGQRTHLFSPATIYELQLDPQTIPGATYSDSGLPIVARRAAPFVSARSYRMLQIDFETGVGTPGSTGSYSPNSFDPKAQLQWSDDGGHTWSNPHEARLGKIGEYQLRVRWRRLGTPRRFGLPRVFRVTITDPVKRIITSAMMDVV